jgi:hypothetical protein
MNFAAANMRVGPLVTTWHGREAFHELEGRQ